MFCANCVFFSHQHFQFRVLFFSVFALCTFGLQRFKKRSQASTPRLMRGNATSKLHRHPSLEYTKRKGDSFLSRAPVYAGRRTYLPTYVRSTVLHGGGGPRWRRRRLVVQGGARRRSAPSGPPTTLFLHFRSAKFKSALKVRDSPNRLHLCAALEGHLHAGS